MKSSSTKGEQLERPLLGALTEDDNAEVVDDDFENVALINKDYRLTTLVTAMVDLAATLSLAFDLDRGKALYDDEYRFSSSVCDIVWLTTLRTVLIMVQSSSCKGFVMAKLAGYVSLLSMLLMVTKACASTQWHEPRCMMILILGMASSAIESLCELFVGTCSSVDDSAETVAPTAAEASVGISVGETKRIKLWELMKVLRPYFWPDGLCNRACVFFTWVFLFIAKGSNIAAPLFIAHATDALPHSTTHTTWNIVAYAALLLCNKAFKEAQSLAYIRVKLTAGVQLQENVFRHLLTLSMDWHQRKSMGTVLTAMQRGIAASNTVVQYIFLYLLPTFIEACVVCVVFVTEFDAPLLAAVAVCGSTLYIAVTVELTIWRMQFRKKMNKANNDASHKATDSLMNFETVKCR